jgi:hypothetical protein
MNLNREEFIAWANEEFPDIFIMLAEPSEDGSEGPTGPVGFYSTPTKAMDALDRFSAKFPGKRDIHIVPAEFDVDGF